MSFGLCGLSRPFLARTNSNRSKERRSLKLNMPGIQKHAAAAGVIVEKEGACGWSENVGLMIELRKKILTFRDILGLPPCDGSGPINMLVIGTIEDLRSLFPNLVPLIVTSETSIHQGLTHLNRALEQVLDLWTKVHKWIANLRHYVEQSLGNNIHLEQPGERVLANLDFTIKVAKQVLHLKEQDRKVNEVRIQDSAIGRTLINSHSDSGITFPAQASGPPDLNLSTRVGELASVSNTRPLLLPLRLEAVEKLNPLSLPTFPEAFERGSSNLHQKDMKRKIDKIEAEEVQKPKCTAKEQTAMGPRSSKAKLDTLELPKLSTDEMQEAGGIEVPPTPPPLSNLPASHPSKLCTNVNGLPPPPQFLPTEGSSAPTPPPPPILPSKGSSSPPPPPTPPILPFKGSSTPAPTPPGAMGKGVAPPPPPPLGAAKTLRPKKTSTKLRRSTQMANLYRALKGKVEGSPLHGKQSQGRKGRVGGSTDGKQGMADALAEITKRSAYFRQIEEDVQKYANSLIEIKSSISSFETKDMVELLRFHKHVELCLEKLTDETQVLSRFEDFPTKKLESLRTAAALYFKLEGILATLQNWKIVPPLNQLLDKVESYYNKIKGEIDTLERSKDEESKRFQSHKIQFDFNILERIKESMVDVSSSCMELALKERRDAAMSERNGAKPDGQKKECIKILWRAFQLAFRVYSFAGGQDDRADTLSKELAKEIETHPQHP